MVEEEQRLRQESDRVSSLANLALYTYRFLDEIRNNLEVNRRQTVWFHGSQICQVDVHEQRDAVTKESAI